MSWECSITEDKKLLTLESQRKLTEKQDTSGMPFSCNFLGLRIIKKIKKSGLKKKKKNSMNSFTKISTRSYFFFFLSQQ